MEEYRFDRLSQNNLYNLISLYRDCFKLKVDIEFLRKKYDTISFGTELIGFIAFDKKTNEAAGYYGVFPMLASISGKTVLVAQSGDTMTHPKHQGKGLFIHLAKITYELAGSEGIDFVFGFPNKNSYPGFKKKLDWVFYKNIHVYSIATRSIPFDKLFKKSGFFESAYHKYVLKKLRKHLTDEVVPNSLQQQEPGCGYIVHDKRFFNYKVFYPSYKVIVNSVKCVVRVDGRLWVGDIDFCSKDKIHMVLDGLIDLAKRIGCSSVQFAVTEDTFYDGILKERYGIKSTNPIGYLSFGGKEDPSRFNYQAVDFDTY